MCVIIYVYTYISPDSRHLCMIIQMESSQNSMGQSHFPWNINMPSFIDLGPLGGVAQATRLREDGEV